MTGMPDLFAKADPVVREIYARVKAAARACGPFVEEQKRTGIHLVRETAFAGVRVRKAALQMTLKSAKDVKSLRIAKHEKASANRWHLDLVLLAPDDVDGELKAWMKAAYALAGKKEPATGRTRS